MGANLPQRKFQSYGVLRKMNVGFAPHYVNYDCYLLRQIAGKREPIASLRYSDRSKLKISNWTNNMPVEVAKKKCAFHGLKKNLHKTH